MNEKKTVGRTRKDILAAATQFLRTCYDQDVSLSETAAAAGVGPRALQIAFREGLNTTPGDWLLKLRLQRARQVLLTAEDGTSVTSAAFGSGFRHLGRFSQRYNEAFGEPPSETLRTAQKLKSDTKRQMRRTIPDTLRQIPFENLREGAPSSDDKAFVMIESSQILAGGDNVFAAWDQLHAILSGKLRYKRGAVIVKRSIDGRPLIFSHCRGGMDDDRFKLDMKRVNTVLTRASGIVHSVLQGGNPRIENDLELTMDYAALDASMQSELCVPLINGGDVVGAINFESERKNAFDLYDLAFATSLSASTAGQLQAARSTGNLGLTGWV